MLLDANLFWALCFVVSIMLSEPALKIIHEDPDFVVVEKASGLLSVPGRGPDKKDCVCLRVRSLYSDCIEHPEVHRLDMDTSGLMVLALNKEAHRNLSAQFHTRKIRKRYVALLEGEIEEAEGTIELPFRLDLENRPRQIFDREHGKMGVTHWQRIAVEEGHTRVEFIPITGRTHQLRVHSADRRGLGSPIVGDPLYGYGTGAGQMKLHACDLGFQHPSEGREVDFHSSPPF